MSTKSMPLVYNPRARRGRAQGLIGSVVEQLASAGIAVEVIASDSRGDIEKKVRTLAGNGHRRILLGGGDGSVHEAVNGLMAGNAPAALGLIPMGTGNDFAKANRIPLSVADAVAGLAARIDSNSPPRTIDVGQLSGRFFANGVGIGFDARVSAIAASINLPIGSLVYPLALLSGLIKGITTPAMSMRADDAAEAQRPVPRTLVSFNVGQWVGGLFPIAPTADNTDGLLDLVFVDALSRRQVVPLVPKLLRGTHLQSKHVHLVRVRTCRVHCDEPLPVHLDGENEPPRKTFDVRSVPAALRLI